MPRFSWKLSPSMNGLLTLWLVLLLVTMGGCPQSNSPTGPLDGGSAGGAGGSSTDGTTSTPAGTSDGGTVTGGQTTSIGDTEGDATAGNDSGVDNSSAGFSEAAIIYFAAGGFPAYPKYGIPAGVGYNTDGDLQTSVCLPRVSKDGDVIWFATQDANGFVEPQLFCMNADGSGVQEIALPADLPRLPTELAPSADGQVCALIIDTGLGTDFSQSTVRLASRLSGQTSLLYDGRLIPDGKDDFSNVQITDDGLTVYFLDIQQNLVCRIPASGGSVELVSAMSEYTKTGCTPRSLINYRINGNASALIAHLWFWGPNATYPNDAYLKTPADIIPLTNTGDLRDATTNEYLGVSDDQHYAFYTRYLQSESRYGVFVYDRTSGRTTRLPTGGSSFPVLFDNQSTVVYTGWAIGYPYSGVDQLPGLGTPDGAQALEITEGHWGPPTLASMSSFGTALVGTWNNGAFGDPSGLYAWFPGLTSYRNGPSITKVEYQSDPTTDTLTIRATVTGAVTEVDLQALYDDFEAFYQVPQEQNPFYNERWGAALAATDRAGVYEYTANLGGVAVDNRFRLRITAADDAAMNFACVDFRPVPVAGEALDANGDGGGG